MKNKYRDGEFWVVDIRPSIRIACDKLKRYDGHYFDVVLQNGSRIHCKLADGTEIEGTVENIIIGAEDFSFIIVSANIDGRIKIQAIDTDDIETVFPYDCDNCADSPTPEKEQNAIALKTDKDTSQGHEQPRINDKLYTYLQRRFSTEVKGLERRHPFVHENSDVFEDVFHTILATLDVVRYEDWDEKATTFQEELYK